MRRSRRKLRERRARMRNNSAGRTRPTCKMRQRCLKRRRRQHRSRRRPGSLSDVFHVAATAADFPERCGGADAVGSIPNKEATTMDEGKSARSRRVGKALCWCATVVFDRAGGSVRWGVCGVARLVHSVHYGPRRAPCIRSHAPIQWCGPSPIAPHGYRALPTRLTRNTQTGSR